MGITPSNWESESNGSISGLFEGNVNINVLQRTPMGLGTKTKYYVDAQIGTEDGRVVDMGLVERPHNHLSNPEQMKSYWLALAQAGIPTYDLLIDDGYSLLYPDFSIRQASYGKAQTRAIADQPDLYIPRHTDAVFRQIMTDGAETLHEYASDIAHRATDFGIELPLDDALDLLIDDMGNWTFFVSDLEDGLVHEQVDDALLARNARAVNRSILNLEGHLSILDQLQIRRTEGVGKFLKRIFSRSKRS